MVLVRYCDINPNSSYGRMVSPAFREQAAITIQRFWRTKKGLSFEHAGNEQSLKVNGLAFLQEPDDTDFADKLVSCIKESAWKQLLPYCQNPLASTSHSPCDEVTRGLFQAFRMEKLTEDDFLTAKQMIDAMHAWQPKEAAIQSHSLDDSQGPYNVRGAFPGSFDAERIDPMHTYVTIKWPMRRVAAFLWSVLDLQDKHKKNISAPVYYEILEKYKKCYIGSGVSDVELKEMLRNKISGHMAPGELKDVYFMAGILSGLATCPTIVVVPSGAGGSMFSVYSVLMPIHTMRFVLKKINVGECVDLCPVIGPVSTRHIRALLERQSGGVLDGVFRSLYPSEEDVAGRPLPVQHPDCFVSKLRPHGFVCGPHLMWLHDIYHLFKCNQNSILFGLMDYLRDYLSTRTDQPCLMNKSLWKLVDMEFLFGMPFDDAAVAHLGWCYHSHFSSGLLMMHHCQVFDMDTTRPDSDAHLSDKNIHLMVDMIRNASLWTSMLQLDRCITECLSDQDSEFFNEEVYGEKAVLMFDGLRDVYEMVAGVLEDYPDAGHTEVFVRCWLDRINEQSKKDTLSFYAAWLVWEDIFEWSNNGPVFFRKSAFDSQRDHGGLLAGFNRRLVTNMPSDVVRVLQSEAFGAYFKSSKSVCLYEPGSASLVDYVEGILGVCVMLSAAFLFSSLMFIFMKPGASEYVDNLNCTLFDATKHIYVDMDMPEIPAFDGCDLPAYPASCNVSV